MICFAIGDRVIAKHASIAMRAIIRKSFIAFTTAHPAIPHRSAYLLSHNQSIPRIV